MDGRGPGLWLYREHFQMSIYALTLSALCGEFERRTMTHQFKFLAVGPMVRTFVSPHHSDGNRDDRCSRRGDRHRVSRTHAIVGLGEIATATRSNQSTAIVAAIVPATIAREVYCIQRVRGAGSRS